MPFRIAEVKGSNPSRSTILNEVRFSNIFIEKRTSHFWKALLYQGLFFLYLGRYTLKIFK